MKNTKKIGIIGGVGPQSTNFIYKEIIKFSQAKYGAKNNDDFPYLIFESLPIPDFINNKKRVPEAKKMLIKSAKTLEAAGATKLAIGSNTVHLLIHELEKHVKTDFISIIEEVSKKVSKQKIKTVGLLGSPVLVKSGLYEKELKKYGVKVILPNSKQLEISESIIRDVLAGVNNLFLKKEYVSLLHSMYDYGAENIILGCTELPQAINYEALNGKTIDSDEVLAEAIVDYYYKK
ncbi:Aspartate racemase [Candidatus Roizmanbacteria bacterium]|nr:Aspartate racemase [Candidatus Roizmanbacteria bacterium]